MHFFDTFEIACFSFPVKSNDKIRFAPPSKGVAPAIPSESFPKVKSVTFASGVELEDEAFGEMNDV